MFEIILFVLAFGADQLIKLWTRANFLPGEGMSLFGNALGIFYAQNFGHSSQVSFIRGRSLFMNIIRILEVAIILYLLIAKRKKMAKITKVGLVLFLAGLIGNQFDYITQNFVTDMFIVPAWSRSPVFNLADVCILVGMIILLIRVMFFEGRSFIKNGKLENKEK